MECTPQGRQTDPNLEPPTPSRQLRELGTKRVGARAFRALRVFIEISHQCSPFRESGAWGFARRSAWGVSFRTQRPDGSSGCRIRGRV